MNTKLPAAIAAVLFATSAFAGGKPQDPPQPPVKAEAEATAKATATATAVGVGVGIGIGKGGDGGDASASANNEGVEQSVAFSSPRQAPSVSAPSVFPTAACQVGFSFGGSNSTGGVGFSFSLTKKECEKYQLSQNLAAIGLTQAACTVLLTTKAAERAFGADKPGCDVPAPASSTSAPVPPQPVVVVLDGSGFATKEEVKRAFEAAVSK